MAAVMSENKCPHLKIKSEDIGRYVILPEDPKCASKIAPFLDGVRQIAQNREYNIYAGTLDGQKVNVCSTGKSGSSAAIAVEELIAGGASTFIRVGTGIGIHPLADAGNLVIAEAAIRAEGTSCKYLPQGCLTIAHFAVTSALAQAAKELSQPEDYRIGIVHSSDDLCGMVNSDDPAVEKNAKSLREGDLKYGCQAIETACAAIYAVGLAHSVFPHNVRCGGVLTMLWDVGFPPYKITPEDNLCAIKCAVRAMKLLIEQDKLDYNRTMSKMHGLIR